MSQGPQWKVYRAGKNGEFIGATKYPEDAAVLVSLAPGMVVKFDHKIVVWIEGSEAFSAAESYDGAARIMNERCDAYWSSRRLSGSQ